MKKKKNIEPRFVSSALNNQMLNYRQYYMSSSEKAMYTLLVFIAGGVVGLIFFGGLFKDDGRLTALTLISDVIVFAVVGIIATIIFLPRITKKLLEKRNKILRKQFMNFLESLSISLSAGNSIAKAFENVGNDLRSQYKESDFIVIETDEINNYVANGLTIEQGLKDFSARCDNEDIHSFSNVIETCNRLGGNFNDTVRRTRMIIADKAAIEEEIATKVASNRLQLNAMCLMPIALVGMLKLSSSDFANNLASTPGVIATAFAIGLIIAAYFWGQKIIDIR